MTGNVSKISGSFRAEPSRVAAENNRVAAENQRIQNEEERQNAESLRQDRYDSLFNRMEEGINAINATVSYASDAVQNANSSASRAESAAEGADTAAALANQKAELAHEKASLAQEKADLANEKAALAESKATAADTAAGKANSASESANSAKINADTAAEGANSAAAAANAAADRVTEPLQAKNITYDNSNSGLASKDVKTALDELQEKFKTERQRFNPLYCNAFFGSAEGASITVNDAVEGTPLALTLYGKCTETLTDSSAEKSPDNPAVITGIGESGSVTVTVTDADGTAKEIAIPLSAPLYGIKHPTTGEWLARDEIRVEDGKVFLIRNIGKTQITENARNISVYAGDKTFAEVYVIQDTATYGNTYRASGVHDKKRLAILSPLLKSGLSNNNNTPTDIALGYPGGYDRQICIRISRATLGVTSEATADEIKAAFKTWVSDYNSTHDIKFDVYYLMKTADTTDVTDTEAGQALLALVSQNGDTITNSDGSDMSLTYNRDINKALAEINNAIIALGGTI